MTPRDDFGELPGLKRLAQKRASGRGHQLSRFRVRLNDDTKLNAFCTTCGSLVVINLDLDSDLPALYGTALMTRCG